MWALTSELLALVGIFAHVLCLHVLGVRHQALLIRVSALQAHQRGPGKFADHVYRPPAKLICGTSTWTTPSGPKLRTSLRQLLLSFRSKQPHKNQTGREQFTRPVIHANDKDTSSSHDAPIVWRCTSDKLTPGAVLVWALDQTRLDWPISLEASFYSVHYY